MSSFRVAVEENAKLHSFYNCKLTRRSLSPSAKTNTICTELLHPNNTTVNVPLPGVWSRYLATGLFGARRRRFRFFTPGGHVKVALQFDVDDRGRRAVNVNELRADQLVLDSVNA